MKCTGLYTSSVFVRWHSFRTVRFSIQAPNFVGFICISILINSRYSAKLNFLIPASWLYLRFSLIDLPRRSFSCFFLRIIHVFPLCFHAFNAHMIRNVIFLSFYLSRGNFQSKNVTELIEGLNLHKSAFPLAAFSAHFFS